MNFTTMTFENLKFAHEKQKYNISHIDEEYDDFYNIMSNFMDFSNSLNGFSDSFSAKNISKTSLLKTYDKAKNIYYTYAVDESEKIRKIKDFFNELNNINIATYKNNAIRPIL